MIAAVCLNPAIDVTYAVPDFHLGDSFRPLTVTRRAGGKGINVAAVLHEAGTPVTVALPIGGAPGAELVADLDRWGIAYRSTPLGQPNRQTVTVVSDHDATVLNEPGPTPTDDEWAAFTTAFAELAAAVDLITLSGSLPGDLTCSAYRDLIAIARERGCPTILDCTGEPLVQALAAIPDVVKLNADEAGDSTGLPCTTRDEAFVVGRRLLELGARQVVITRGSAGLVALTDEGCFSAAVAGRVAGNPTGAGDAFTAGLALATTEGRPWPDRLRTAAGWAAGAVARPVAGSVDPTVAADHERRTEILAHEAPQGIDERLT